MTDKRWETMYKQLVAVGILKDNLNYQDAYTLDFVNKGVDYYQS
jgi:NitT/TauT family transport system substrate-binding protein